MESWETTIVELQILSQHFLIVVRRASDIRSLGFHAVHVCLRNGCAEKQFAARHAVVAVRMVGGNVALIAPENVYLGPVHLPPEFGRSEKLEHRARCVAAR